MKLEREQVHVVDKADREQLIDFLKWVQKTFDGLLEIESPVQYTENGEVVAPKLWLHMDEWLKEADTGKLVDEYLDRELANE